MKRALDGAPAAPSPTRRARGETRGGDTAALAAELLAVQALRDLLVEAWVGAIADGGRPARPARARRAAQVPGKRARPRARGVPDGWHAPIRERILAEIERQQATPTAATRKARRPRG